MNMNRVLTALTTILTVLCASLSPTAVAQMMVDNPFAHESIPEDVDAVVTLTVAELNAASRPEGGFNGLDVDGDAAPVQRLDRLLDREVGGFYMHMR